MRSPIVEMLLPRAAALAQARPAPYALSMRNARLLVCGSCFLLACTETPAPSAKADPNLVSFSVETSVEPASEVQLCKYIEMPRDKGDVLAVDAITHTYTEGSHHFLVYKTTLAEMPAGGDTLVPCEESAWMTVVRGVAYAAQSPEGEIVLPEGVSQRFQSGEVLLLQTHYLNAGSEALSARIDFDLHLTTVEAAPTEAGVLFFFNPIIHLPPNGAATAELSCPIPADANLIFAASHMHKQGTRFRADIEGGDDARKLYETSEWAEPLPLELDAPSGTLKAGDRIRYACDFENAGPQTITAGPSAATDEMCMFIGMYYPRLDSTTELCNAGAATTLGSASCLDTLACARACNDDVECRASCLDQVCPTAAMPMLRFVQCVAPSCGELCAEAGTDSDMCQSCVTSSCPLEAIACQSATCEGG